LETSSCGKEPSVPNPTEGRDILEDTIQKADTDYDTDNLRKVYCTSSACMFNMR